MKSNPSIIALKDFENISNIRLSLARYSTAPKGPEYKRKWMTHLLSDLEYSEFTRNIVPNYQFIHNMTPNVF